LIFYKIIATKDKAMKKITSVLSVLILSQYAFGAAETLEGGSTSETAVDFLSTYDNTTTLTLIAPVGATTSYFDGNGQTIKTLASTATTDVSITGGFTMSTGSSAITAISFGGSALDNQLTFSSGTYNVSGTAAIRFDIDSYITAATNTKAFIIASDATMNVTGTSLSLVGPYLAGSAGASNSFTINGALNVYSSAGGYGTLNIYWTTKSFDSTTRGTRTNLNIDGGTVSAKDVNLSPFSFLNVQNGGTINSTGTFTFAGSAANQPGVFNLYANSTANLNNIVYYIGTGSYGTGMNLNVYGTLNATGTLSYAAQTVYIGALTSLLDVYSGGNAHVATVDLSSVGNINVRLGGTFKSDTTTLGGNATIASSGSTDLGATTITGGTLTAYNGGTVDMGASTLSGGAIAVNSGGALTASSVAISGGTITAYSGGTANLGASSMNGGTLTVGGSVTASLAYTSGTIAVNSGGALTLASGSTGTYTNTTTVAGTLNVASGADISFGATTPVMTSGTLNIAGKVTSAAVMTVNNLNITGELDQTAVGNLVINNGGSLGAGSKLTMHGGLWLGTGTFTVNADNVSAMLGSSAQNARIVMAGNNGTLIINKADAFTNSSGGWVNLVGFGTNAATFVINATQHFANLNIPDNNVKLKFILDSAATDYLMFMGIVYFGSGTNLTFQNFQDGRIYFASTSAFNADKITALDALGNNLGAVELREDGWLYLAVPEPAEWAAILGGVALLFALYRKRGKI